MKNHNLTLTILLYVKSNRIWIEKRRKKTEVSSYNSAVMSPVQEVTDRVGCWVGVFIRSSRQKNGAAFYWLSRSHWAIPIG